MSLFSDSSSKKDKPSPYNKRNVPSSLVQLRGRKNELEVQVATLEKRVKELEEREAILTRRMECARYFLGCALPDDGRKQKCITRAEKWKLDDLSDLINSLSRTDDGDTAGAKEGKDHEKTEDEQNTEQKVKDMFNTLQLSPFSPFDGRKTASHIIASAFSAKHNESPFKSSSSSVLSTIVRVNGEEVPRTRPVIHHLTNVPDQEQNSIQFKYLTISAMRGFRNFSVEELRLADYLADDKGNRVFGGGCFAG